VCACCERVDGTCVLYVFGAHCVWGIYLSSVCQSEAPSLLPPGAHHNGHFSLQKLDGLCIFTSCSLSSYIVPDLPHAFFAYFQGCAKRLARAHLAVGGEPFCRAGGETPEVRI